MEKSSITSDEQQVILDAQQEILDKKEAERRQKAYVKSYLGLKSGRGICDAVIRNVLASVADTAVIPMQDYLGLGGEARMNVPSTLGTNWKWRMRSDALTPELSAKLKEWAVVYRRTVTAKTCSKGGKGKKK